MFKYYSVLFFVTWVSAANAALITNEIQGIGPHNEIEPFLCIQNASGKVVLPLAPNQTGDVNEASGKDYYAGGALRFQGCDADDNYLGYVDIYTDKTGKITGMGYEPFIGVHVTYAKQAIQLTGQVSGLIEYTPIAFNDHFSPASEPIFWRFAGINLSGLEFGKIIDPTAIPNLSSTDRLTSYTDLRDTEAFIKGGMNIVRLPLSWSYLQWDGPGQGELNHSYYDNFVRPILQTLTQAKVYVIVDLHAFMRYATFGKEYSGCAANAPCPDGKLVLDQNAYQSIWNQLWNAIKTDSGIDSEYILLDLVNEPVGVPDNKVFTIQTSLIKMLREEGFTGYILVEGNARTGLHSWSTETWKGKNGQLYTNATLFTRENFAKEGVTDLTKILINVHQYLDTDFTGTHDDCQGDLNTTGREGFNLDAFVTYLQQNHLQAIVTAFGSGRDASSCGPALQNFMEYLKQHAAQGEEPGFVGWTIWSTGHGWHGAPFQVKPDSYQIKVLGPFLRSEGVVQ